MSKVDSNKRWKLKHPRRHQAKNILGQIRFRSRKAGMECDLDIDWLHSRFVKGTCEITGLPFTFKRPEKKGAKAPFTPSVDRIDPTKGYTKDNCQVILWCLNRAKGEYDYHLLYHWAVPFVKAYEQWIEDSI